MESFAFPDKIMMILKTKKIWEFLALTDKVFYVKQRQIEKLLVKKEPFEHQTLDHSQVTRES